jgi:hypothetical protein
MLGRKHPESNSDSFDLKSLRFGDVKLEPIVFKRRPPRHQQGDLFIKGPISHNWLTTACQLPGSGLAVAMAYRLRAGKSRSPRGRRWGVNDIARDLQISDDSAQRGLHLAELARLLSVSRETGHKTIVSVLEMVEPETGSSHRPLRGPIPWAWWLPASRLPGKALQVAAVCWLLAGWGRSAEFELAPDDWSEFGLSRFSASRGLDALAQAGLISAVRQRDRSPVVTILDSSDNWSRLNGIPLVMPAS